MATLSLAVVGGSLVVGQGGVGKIESLTRSAKVWRRARATSPNTHGSVQTHATLEDAELVAVLSFEAADHAALETLCEDVEAELVDQFSYLLDVAEAVAGGEVIRRYDCDGADVVWEPYDDSLADRLMRKGSFTIPVFPISTRLA